MLGAMMIDNRLADDLVDRLEPVHFFEPVHGRVFAAIKTLRAADMLVENLVKVTIFLARREDAAANRAIRNEVLEGHPTALTVILPAIFDAAWLVEIEAVAAA